MSLQISVLLLLLMNVNEFIAVDADVSWTYVHNLNVGISICKGRGSIGWQLKACICWWDLFEFPEKKTAESTMTQDYFLFFLLPHFIFRCSYRKLVWNKSLSLRPKCSLIRDGRKKYQWGIKEKGGRGSMGEMRNCQEGKDHRQKWWGY